MLTNKIKTSRWTIELILSADASEIADLDGRTRDRLGHYIQELIKGIDKELRVLTDFGCGPNITRQETDMKSKRAYLETALKLVAP